MNTSSNNNSNNGLKPRLQARRDAMSNVLDNMTDESYARLHDIHDEEVSQSEQGTATCQEAGTNCSAAQENMKPRPTSALSDRSVLRSPRFHQRRDAVQDGENVSRAMCSRLKQLQLINNNSVPGTVC